MKKYDGLRECARQCMHSKNDCTVESCKFWINYKDEHNCTLVAIYENGKMTLRQVAERLGISFARVKQIESEALIKLKKRCVNNDITF